MPRMVRFTLSKLRVEAGYETLQRGAEALGISRVHLANLERGRGGASEEVLTRMAQVYRVPRETLEEEIRKAQRSLLRRQLAST